MSRKEELLSLIDNETTLVQLIDEMVYLEEQLDCLRSLPKIKIHPKDPTKQKPTPASKLYKEYLQQYVNVVKILLRATGADETEEESPLREWMRQHVSSE